MIDKLNILSFIIYIIYCGKKFKNDMESQVMLYVMSFFFNTIMIQIIAVFCNSCGYSSHIIAIGTKKLLIYK